MADTIELRARQRLNARIEDLLARNTDDPKWWSDADKLRMIACLLDKRDYDEGIFDHDEVQIDLRRIANRLETLDA